MGSLPIGYAERAWRLEDAEAIAAMINAYSKTVWGREEVGAESLRAQMQTPGVTLATDTRLVLGPGGGIAAVGFAIDLAEPHVLVQSSGYVRHKDQSRGIGGWLADWIETRAREAIDRAPAGARVAVMQSVDDRDARAKELLEARGYQVVRHFWRMAIELSHSVPAAQWPDGIRVAALDSGIDLRRAYAAGREAFKDHWGHVESSEEEGFERFMYRLENDPDIDRSLRFVALDGDEIAAVCYANPRDGVDERAGYIELLGVRPAWRKRGLALGLLRHAFAALRERGRIGCSLHVDSESLTGATRVYEKAGMHVSELNHAYELELRPGKDLVKRTASS
jgi:mycothiol synthase